ncbi:thymidylate synthase [Flavobacterium sp. ANB]|uniref:thymidylate synthase n=1 Tax=Flavobacterium sp. ANB TaxID=2783790 RepID=UPI00188C41A3|nr:thymidylate synthase [Flavobacterium sp. ANB]MBF4519168.1 thymidylate synthase [Flavobacterium sp. ANB]
MNTKPYVIEETNVSKAYYKTLKFIYNHSGNEVSPLVLTLTGFEESLEFKEILNSELLSGKHNNIDMVAETIFPNSLYQFLDYDRHALYKTYGKNIARIKKIDTRNRRGTYFDRLIAYGDVNQLEIIIDSLQVESKVRRRSKLQASIFDPSQDHLTDAFQGFPCLQHVTFAKSETGGLILNSFYAIQYLYEKAYGNWLGLINLGKFVARETDMEFERFNCFVGVEKAAKKMTKKQMIILLNKFNKIEQFSAMDNE